MNHLLNLFQLGYRLQAIENAATSRVRLLAPNGALVSLTPVSASRAWGV